MSEEIGEHNSADENEQSDYFFNETAEESEDESYDQRDREDDIYAIHSQLGMMVYWKINQGELVVVVHD